MDRRLFYLFNEILKMTNMKTTTKNEVKVKSFDKHSSL